MIHVIATSHGTHHEEGRQSLQEVREEMAALLNEKHPGQYRVHEAYVDVQEPTPGTVAASLAGEQQAVIVPLLLSTGYHTQIDLKKAAEQSAASETLIAAPLGPSAALAKLQRTRLTQIGWEGYGDTVMAAAGSSRPDGRDAVQLQSEIFSTLLSQYVPYGFVADIEPQIETVVEEDLADYVSSYLLGRGHFQNHILKMAEENPNLLVAEPLLVPGDRDAARVVAEVAVQRLLEAS